MAVNATTGLQPARPIPANPAAITPAEQEAIQCYDAALGRSVAIIAQAAGDNYSDFQNPSNVCKFGLIWQFHMEGEQVATGQPHY
jgi:hypothetical protein